MYMVILETSVTSMYSIAKSISRTLDRDKRIHQKECPIEGILHVTKYAFQAINLNDHTETKKLKLQ